MSYSVNKDYGKKFCSLSSISASHVAGFLCWCTSYVYMGDVIQCSKTFNSRRTCPGPEDSSTHFLQLYTTSLVNQTSNLRCFHSAVVTSQRRTALRPNELNLILNSLPRPLFSLQGHLQLSRGPLLNHINISSTPSHRTQKNSLGSHHKACTPSSILRSSKQPTPPPQPPAHPSPPPPPVASTTEPPAPHRPSHALSTPHNTRHLRPSLVQQPCPTRSRN